MRGLQLGRPFYETTKREGAGIESRTIQVSGDVVTVRTPLVMGYDTVEYTMDGQPHEYKWGDTVPQAKATRTSHWTLDGFESVVDWATERWTLSDSLHLKEEIEYNRPCPPCAPGVVHDESLFTRAN
jgi:hypothetical protein